MHPSTTSVGVGLESVCLFVSPSVVRSITQKTNDPKVFKLGGNVGIDLETYYSGIQRTNVKVTGSITLHNDNSFQTIQLRFIHIC